MICKYDIHPDICDAMRAMDVNILEKVSFFKSGVRLLMFFLFHPEIPEVFSRRWECPSNNIDMAKINIEISTPYRKPPKKNMNNQCRTFENFDKFVFLWWFCLLDILDIGSWWHFECDVLGPVKRSLDQRNVVVIRILFPVSGPLQEAKLYLDSTL